MGVAVGVDVEVGVDVGVGVGVDVGVDVDVAVGVDVGVDVDVAVGVDVATATAVKDTMCMLRSAVHVSAGDVPASTPFT